MKNPFILKEIYRQNKHWRDPKELFFDIQHIEYQRMLYFDLLKALEGRHIISLVGLRRVGKTVLLKQLIAHLLLKTHADNILFLTFDEALLPHGTTLADYIDAYLESKAPKKEQVTIFLDEIQYAPRWQHILKRYYDTEPYIKFIVSGSSSLFLKKKTTESLAGRINEFFLSVLSFEEYLSLKAVSTVVVDAYQRAAVAINDRGGGAEQTVVSTQYGAELLGHFEDYLRFGQFPELIALRTDAEKQKYLEEAIFKKAVEYDIPRIFGVEKVDELKFLFAVILSESGSLVEPTNLAAEVGIDNATIKKYLSYLEQSFLAYPLYNYSKSFRKSRRLLRKIYTGSSNFLSLFTDWRDSDTIQQRMGMMVEQYVFDRVRRSFRYYSFYRVRHHEFDFFCANDLRDTREFHPIEVKWRPSVDPRELRFLFRTAQKQKGRPLIISRETFEKTEKYMIIPAWLLK